MSALEVGILDVGTTELRFLESGHSYEGWNYGKSNAAGGIGVKHNIYNASNKSMKYITFVYVPYNKVGDAVASTTSGEIEVRAKLTGPFNPHQESEVQWPVLWYNPTIVEVKLKEVLIQYMDGSEEIIGAKDIDCMDRTGSAYYETIKKPREKKAAEERAERAKQQKEFEERSEIYSASQQIFLNAPGAPKKKNLENNCATVFLRFKDDEATLLKVLDKLAETIEKSSMWQVEAAKGGAIIGDYIEKEYYSNKELMKKAVLLWKASVSVYQKPYLAVIESVVRLIEVRKLAQKIRQYEPAYVIPPKNTK